MSEAQDRYALIAGGFDRRVQATDAGQWDAASPCEGWKARDIVEHVVNNHRGLLAGIEGGEDTPMSSSEDPKTAWSDVFRKMSDLTGSEQAMATSVQGPMGPMPLADMLNQFVTMDVFVHTWDLARAVGGDEKLDGASVARVHEALRPMDAMIRMPGVFGAKLDPPAGADAQTELLYFLGRKA